MSGGVLLQDARHRRRAGRAHAVVSHMSVTCQLHVSYVLLEIKAQGDNTRAHTHSLTHTHTHASLSKCIYRVTHTHTNLNSHTRCTFTAPLINNIYIPICDIHLQLPYATYSTATIATCAISSSNYSNLLLCNLRQYILQLVQGRISRMGVRARCLTCQLHVSYMSVTCQLRAARYQGMGVRARCLAAFLSK